MKKLFILAVAFAFSFPLFSQESYLQRIPAFPTTSDHEVVNKFLDELSKLRDEIKVKETLYEKENREAAEKLDPAAVAAAYSSGMDVDAVMAMQKRQQDLIDNNNKLAAVQSKIAKYNDSLKALFTIDFNPYEEKRSNYINKCVGEVGSGNNCSSLMADMNALGNKILMKYWFSNGSEYKKYLAMIRSELEKINVLVVVQGMETTEIGGVKIPHKQDLGYVKFALDYISFIQNAWSIDSKLWPMF
ncbi:MAG: hypothetical protein V2A54_04515 [Bacteroidota bacterium]